MGKVKERWTGFNLAYSPLGHFLEKGQQYLPLCLYRISF